MQPKLVSFVKELNSGSYPSVNQRQVPFWEYVSEFEFSTTGLHKVKGTNAQTTSTGFPLRGIAQLTQFDGNSYAYMGDRATLFRWSGNVGTAPANIGGGYTGINHETATASSTTWSMVPFGDWMLCTNGVDVPQVIKGSAASPAALAGVAGNFTTAQVFVALNEHIIALNTSNGPYEIRWSSSGNAELWLPATTNSAGFLSLREARSPIIAGVKLQQYIGVYTKEDLFLLEHVGSPTLRFRVTHAINGIGSVSKQAVVSVGRMNYGLGQQGFWRTDGGTFEYIDDPAVRGYFSGVFNTDQQTKVCAYHIEAETSVYWWYPTGSGNTENSEGLSYNYKHGTWAVRTALPRTTGIERGVFDWALTGTTLGVHLQENYGDFTGLSEATTKPMDLGDEQLTKVITGIRVNYKGNGLRVRVGYRDTEAEASTFTSLLTVTSGRIIPLRVSGKFIQLDFQSSTSTDNSDIYAIDLFGRVAGRRTTI